MFKVRGWKKDRSEGYCPEHDDGDENYGCHCLKTRSPITEVKTIQANDGKAAAFRYAERYNIHRSEWWECGPKPFVVIRVSNLEDQDP